MRFDAWKPVYDELRDEVVKYDRDSSARAKAAAAFRGHCALAERQYVLAPSVALLVVYQPVAKVAGVIRSALIRLSLNGHEWGGGLHYLTASDLRSVAEVIETSDAWEAGFIDEMPQNGTWKRPAPRHGILLVGEKLAPKCRCGWSPPPDASGDAEDQLVLHLALARLGGEWP